MTLGRDEATMVRNGQQPTEKQAVLRQTKLEAPPDNSDIFNASTPLQLVGRFPMPWATGWRSPTTSTSSAWR